MSGMATGSIFHTRLQTSASRLLWIGIAMVLVGAAAIVFPMVSTLVATLLVGLLTALAGAFVLFNPLSAALALTIVIGIVFLVQGAYELAFAFEMRPARGWLWMLLSALASILLAAVIAVGLPSISVIALGILLGINFLSSGIGYIFVAQALRAA